LWLFRQLVFTGDVVSESDEAGRKGTVFDLFGGEYFSTTDAGNETG
jgi:hypothetical protein